MGRRHPRTVGGFGGKVMSPPWVVRVERSVPPLVVSPEADSKWHKSSVITEPSYRAAGAAASA